MRETFRVARSWMDPEWKVTFLSRVMYRCQRPTVEKTTGIEMWHPRKKSSRGDLRKHASSCSAGQLLLTIITEPTEETLLISSRPIKLQNAVILC